MKRLLGLAAALAVALVASLSTAGAAPQSATETGVTSDKIVLGATFPFSGPVSSYAPIARGMQAYFSYVNARRNKGDGKRGVYGRQIVFKTYDDSYNPAQTVQFTRQLILQDKVFAIVGTLGTEPNLPIRPILNQRKIPHIMVFTGASTWGLKNKCRPRCDEEFPWTLGWIPDYRSEGRVLAQWIARNRGNARIAIFYQNDAYGTDYLTGFRKGLGSKTSQIVSQRSYEVTDADYRSQIGSQRASGADLWVLFTTAGTPTVRALGTARAAGWRPEQIVINSVAATDGVMRAAQAVVGAEFLNGTISTGYLKNPTNPKYANDAAIQRYRRIVSKYVPGADTNNGFFLTGFAAASDATRLLFLAGKNPTRASLMRATERMNWVNPYTIKGIRVKTSKTDRFPISQLKLVRYNNGTWSEISGLFTGRGRAPKP